MLDEHEEKGCSSCVNWVPKFNACAEGRTTELEQWETHKVTPPCWKCPILNNLPFYKDEYGNFKKRKV